MLLPYFLMLSIIGYSSIHAGIIQDHGDYIENIILEKGELYINSRCSNNEEQLEDILMDLEFTKNYYQRLLPGLIPHEDGDAQEQCYENRDKFMYSLKNIVDLLEPCLPPEEAYLPQFIIESADNFTEFVCEHTESFTLQGMVENNMIRCIENAKRSSRDSPISICLQTIDFGNHSYEDAILEEELCEGLDNLYSCYEDQFIEYCPNAEEAWAIVAGLLNGLRSPCLEECTTTTENQEESTSEGADEDAEEHTNEDDVEEETTEENSDEQDADEDISKEKPKSEEKRQQQHQKKKNRIRWPYYY